MDFDDLDDAIDARIADGDIEGLEALGSLKEKVELKKYVPTNGMKPIPRDHRLPSVPRKSGYEQVSLRVFVFYGPGGFASAFHGVFYELPEWLEIVTYEYPGHGTRKEEPLAADLDALVEDAFEAVKPSMLEVKAGAEMEGAPFAFVGHSLGVQVMNLVAKKVLFQYQLEPSLAVILDRAPLNYSLLSEEGKAAVDSNPAELLKAFATENLAMLEAVKAETLSDLKMSCEARDGGDGFPIHKFECDLLVLKSGEFEALDYASKNAGKSSVQYRMLTLTIEDTDKSIRVPIEYGTKASQIKDTIGPIFGYKGKATKVQLKKDGDFLNESQTVEGSIIITGLVDFEHPRYPWPHPTAIIGTGFWGVKMGMQYSVQRNENFVMFDRHDRAGGDAWIQSATKHSRIQTDMGAFNIWFGHEYNYTGQEGWGSNPDAGARAQFSAPFKGPGAPPRGPFTGETGAGSGVDYHPVREQVIGTMNYAMKEYNFHDKAYFSTEISQLRIVGKEDAHDRSYDLTMKSTDKNNKTYDSKVFKCSVIYHFPGAYDINRLIEYPGEKEFGGQIGYGMGSGLGGLFCWDDGRMKGSRAAILGNGAFSVENVRSCCENEVSKVYLVTRRRSLPCPRIPCWFCHQGSAPTPAYMLLDAFKPMYELAGIGDPWGYYAVNKITPTNVKISQSSRFGIGDVTFIALAYGIMEYRDGVLDHCTKHTMHLKLTNGKEDKLEDMHHICKALGLLGDPRVDKLHAMTHRYGNMINGDFRRILIADATGMDATRFTTFSAGPGACSFVKQWYYMHNHPWEFDLAKSQGMMKLLPKHTISNTQPDQTVYMTNVQYEMACGSLFGSFFPNSWQVNGDEDTYMYCLVHEMHPSDKFLEYCQKDWDRYQGMFKEHNGCADQPYIPYPYTKEMICGWFDRYNQDVKPFGGQGQNTWEGPTEEMKFTIINNFKTHMKNMRLNDIPKYVLEALHKEKPDDVDPYAVAAVSEFCPLRQKYFGSKSTSSQDFDGEAYAEWTKCTAEEAKTDFETIHGPKSLHFLSDGGVWFSKILPKLYEKCAKLES